MMRSYGASTSVSVRVQNWLLLLPDGTETVVRVLAANGAATPAALLSERAEREDPGDRGSWRLGLVLSEDGELDGFPYECLALIERAGDR